MRHVRSALPGRGRLLSGRRRSAHQRDAGAGRSRRAGPTHRPGLLPPLSDPAVVADGGMGRVYEALDMVERRNVALKILHPDVARDEVAVERFKREFEVSRMLPHAHIVEVLDFQPTHDGTYALVMEFFYGEELAPR